MLFLFSLQTKMGDFLCGICGRQFTNNFNLNRHMKSIHDQTQHMCTICGRTYKRQDDLKTHIRRSHSQSLPKVPATRTATTSSTDPTPPTTIQTKQELTKSAHTSSTKETDQVTPSKQPISTKRESADSLSNNKRYKQTDELGTLETLPDDVRQTYTENWDAIKTHTNIHEYLSTYTFFHSPLTLFPINLDTTLVDTIFNTQTKRFKINYSHNLILRHKDTQELRFFHASVNNGKVLDTPLLINNRTDFDRFLETLRNTSLLDTALHNRPNTEYTVEAIPATSFYIYHLNSFSIG